MRECRGMYIYIYIYMHMHIYIYIYIHMGIVLNACQYGVLYLGSYYNTGPYIHFPHFWNSNLGKLPYVCAGVRVHFMCTCMHVRVPVHIAQGFASFSDTSNEAATIYQGLCVGIIRRFLSLWSPPDCRIFAHKAFWPPIECKLFSEP